MLDLLTADYTFVNERLARHYGIPNVYGSQFRRVTGLEDQRRGLLGKGGILLVTSHADRTSPVVRGKWILDNLLGSPPPPPPPDVPALPEPKGNAPLTMRARIEQHRGEPGLRGLPQGDGSARPVAGELRRRRRLADTRTPAHAIDASARFFDGTRARRRRAVCARCCCKRRRCSSAR